MTADQLGNNEVYLASFKGKDERFARRKADYCNKP